MAASDKQLGALHQRLTQVLIEAMEGQTVPGYIDPDSGEVTEDQKIPPSAAVMTVAAKFLKDNNITCVVAEDNDLGELQRIMAERQKRARVMQIDAADRASVADSVGFMGSA